MINIIAVRHLKRKKEWNLVWDNKNDFGIIEISEESALTFIALNISEKTIVGSIEVWSFM